jgi:hypothetical protein
LTFRQEEWLREHVLQDADVIEMGEPEWRNLLRYKLPLFLAIALVEEGHTRKAKVDAGWTEVQALAEYIATSGDPVALWSIVPDFFVSNPPASLWMLIKYDRLGAAARTISTTSETPSVSLPMATSPNGR